MWSVWVSAKHKTCGVKVMFIAPFISDGPKSSIVGKDAVQPPAGPAPPQKGIVSSNVDPCAAASTKSQRFVCQKLFKWDKNARAAPPLQRATLPKMPSIAGVPSPDVGGESGPIFIAAASIAATPYECMDLGCLCEYVGGKGQEGSNICKLANGQPLRKALRKEYRMLTDDERARYHAALKAIKKSGEYDNIARIHSNPTIVGGAHSGPAFLPWHREYLKRMEIALRQVDPTIAIPYWDSSLEAQLPTPADSHLFTKEFMGSTDEQGNLVYGHFANWKTIEGNPNIRRRVGGDGKGFTEDEINWFLNQVQIDQIMTYSAPQPGITHGNVHLFVGGFLTLPNGTLQEDGDMAEQTRSANDPIFFMHHSFVDYLWEMWRQSKQTRENRETEYPMDNAPWQNRDGLSNKYTDNMYEYAPRPNCRKGPNCGSKLLFCDRSHGQPHCAAKVRPGGNCTGFINGEDVCLNGICQNGKCQQTNNHNTPKPMPPSTATTEKPIRPVQSCYNEHECCSVWAQKGECQQNPGYMHAWCKASCQQLWGLAGECHRNPTWMNCFCRVSCGRCIPQDYDFGGCADYHQRCRHWAKSGECGRNAWMLEKTCRR
ncbi:hypothetical protein GPALN_010906 [Globodera pallida]|nr:hypothetical protein GPALN_010906 [Globodera pallida]